MLGEKHPTNIFCSKGVLKMKKRTVKAAALALAFMLCFAVGVSANSLLEKIEAYMNYGITIKLDGNEQIMYNAVGDRVYPISYEGTTYVPIRAVSNMLGIDVDWDGPNNTVLLGKTGEYKDFIETVLPYTQSDNGAYINHFTVSDSKTKNIGGKTYNNYIEIMVNNGEIFYNLEGKYEELIFSTFCNTDNLLGEFVAVKVFGDNGELLKTIEVKPYDLPEATTIDVKGVQQLSIKLTKAKVGEKDNFLYIVDAKIK